MQRHRSNRMLRRFCGWPGPGDDVTRAFCREKVTTSRPAVNSSHLRPRTSAVYSWGLDKCVTMTIGLRPDAAGRLPLLACSWADSRPGFASFCARAAAVWLARGSIPSLEKRLGSLPPAIGGCGSCSQEKGVPPRRERAGCGTKDRRLFAGQLDRTRVPTNVAANLRPAGSFICPGRPAGAEPAEPQHCGNEEADGLRHTDGAAVGA